MKTLTPAMAWHNRDRVSSLDWQPRPQPEDRLERPRLATGGDDHHVVIWEVHFGVESEKPSVPIVRVLCDLARHQNSVNVVRWSADGTLLASGDTDSYIYLWHHRGEDAAPDIFDGSLETGGGDEDNRETWSVRKVLRGHLQDVVGLAFSPCGLYLASCSTDSTAILFDLKKGTKLKILSEHAGWVNGVAWDPRGQFIASISSDRNLRLYHTKNYKPAFKVSKSQLALTPRADQVEEKKVRLFHDDTFQSFFRRLAFSPDGEILAVPSGVLEVEGQAETPHCTYLFARTDFSRPALYLPNREFSVAVRFSPLKYKLRPSSKKLEVPEEAKPWEKTETLFCLPYRMIFAVATKTTVMFYDTQQSIPFARVSKIHYVGLTDLSWSPDGNVVMVSSSDGFCSFVTFKEGELGEIYEEEKKAASPPLETDNVKESKMEA
eukprot:maker-scaffold13_size735724-snap-gene-6.28 protein:Tk03471 transcript:maker-scaffold13_size735724-snap-gene-6.28-mRNA-1 annotation:"GI20194"